MTRRRLFRLSVLALLILTQLSSNKALAQAVFGKIVGTVTDPSGAAVPGANVLIRDIDRSTEYHSISGSQGEYAQGQLLAGSHAVTVTESGFGKFTSTVQVHVDTTVEVNAKLEVGTQSG